MRWQEYAIHCNGIFPSYESIESLEASSALTFGAWMADRNHRLLTAEEVAGLSDASQEIRNAVLAELSVEHFQTYSLQPQEVYETFIGEVNSIMAYFDTLNSTHYQHSETPGSVSSASPPTPVEYYVGELSNSLDALSGVQPNSSAPITAALFRVCEKTRSKMHLREAYWAFRAASTVEDAWPNLESHSPEEAAKYVVSVMKLIENKTPGENVFFDHVFRVEWRHLMENNPLEAKTRIIGYMREAVSIIEEYPIFGDAFSPAQRKMLCRYLDGTTFDHNKGYAWTRENAAEFAGSWSSLVEMGKSGKPWMLETPPEAMIGRAYKSPSMDPEADVLDNLIILMDGIMKSSACANDYARAVEWVTYWRSQDKSRLISGMTAFTGSVDAAVEMEKSFESVMYS
ncbi:hypothetical protein [Streptomyces vinaceus]|uniref:hypothetical protein n=1 Tax=Streptomyces vinaceus TaxID=1960 RepID=UPI0038056DD8